MPTDTIEPDWDAIVPEVTLRPQQREALHEIWRAFFVDERRIVMFEAPTGVGKSIIELAMCRYIGNGYIVTPQRVLQDQMDGWDGLAIMKGKSSYDCTLSGGNKTAATAPCRLSMSIREDNLECSDQNCPFFRALAKAKTSPTVVHNYASLMAQTHISGHFAPRGLLCLDEGHTAASWIRNYMSCDLEPSDLESLTSEEPPRRLEHFVPWLRWVMSDLDEVPDGLTDTMSMTMMKLVSHRREFGMLTSHELHETYIESEVSGSYEAFAKRRLMGSGSIPWVTLWNEPDHWHPDGWWSIIPLKVAPVSGVLTNMGTRVLIVTATVLNVPLLRVELGLGGFDPAAVIIGSAFPVENRPVVRRYVGKVTYRTRGSMTPKLIDEIVKIASKHPNERGIVHSVSHALSRDLTDGLRSQMGGRRNIERLPYGPTREGVIHRFLAGDLGQNAILVGPSLMEGVDGVDDTCRWQVMAKVPWPSMTDPVVKHLMGSDDENVRRWANAWYTWKTVQQTVQGIGRVCRSATDHGTTYLLDSGFGRIIESGYVPKYVLEAIK